MSQVWLNKDNRWTVQALTGGSFRLAPAGAAADVLLLRSASASPDAAWLLIASASRGVRVNGEPVLLGVRALSDRDEIRLPGAAPVYFSTEKLVAVEPYTGPAGGRCARCTKEIVPGSPAVRCGTCSTWFHQSEERGCFTYGTNPICVTCANDAVVSGEFSWTPEEV